MTDNEKIAQLLFPEVKQTVEDIENKYPNRNLLEGAQVTRFAPSPTGFVHIGAIYTSLICSLLSSQSHGVFILRIEDTDKNREVEGGVEAITIAFRDFKIKYDEGVFFEIHGLEEKGNYGPYKQSERKDIYAVYAKYLVSKGLAYPCFCTQEELDELRKAQEAEGIKPGYYGKYAKHRNITVDEVEREIDKGKKFAIRIKADGDGEERINIIDVLKGSITMPVNDQDYVLLKSDGLPTYHLAMPIDDHLMKITLVLRGDEWLPSTPLHLQLFRYFGWESPKIGHLATMQKLDGTSKRKLSKRKDPEADVTFYIQEGYPVEGVNEYLLNIANSNFEDWRKQNPDKPYTDFKFSTSKMHASGALVDKIKLEDVCKQYIGRMSPKDELESVIEYSHKYNAKFANLLKDNYEYSLKILSIESDQKGKRKDISKWSQVENQISYFYDEVFNTITANGYDIPENIDREDMIKALELYLPHTNEMDLDKNSWFDRIKKIAEEVGYTTNTKEYRQNPQNFKGYVGDIATFFRIALADRVNTPDLQEIMKVMGKERVNSRISGFLAFLKEK